MKVLQEDYLSDGGIRIVASVKATDISIRSESNISRLEAAPIQRHQDSGPKPVSVEEWKRIIEKMVKIDQKTVSEGE